MKCDLFLNFPDCLFFRSDSRSWRMVSSSNEMVIRCFILYVKNYYYYLKVTDYLLSIGGNRYSFVSNLVFCLFFSNICLFFIIFYIFI